MNFWCSEQIVVSIEGPEGSREELIAAPLARVGAHPRSDIVLAGDGVAKRALYLHATADGLYSLDLDLEDTALDARGRWVAPTDVLNVGPYRLRARTVRGKYAPVGSINLVARGSNLPPLPVLNIYCSRLLKDKRRFRSRLSLLGRRPQCSLQLRGAQVSSFHCALYWEQRRLWCIDLLSSNGTQLNGQPLDCDEVHMTDRLGVGEFELEYHRWSPRRSMQPGWEPAHSADVLDDDLHSSALLAEAGAISGESPADSGSSVIAALPHSADLQQQLIEELARLARERLDLQRQWTETSQQLAVRIDHLHVELVKLSQERAALESARTAWAAERELLTASWERRARDLDRLESQMSAATRSLAQRLANIEKGGAAAASGMGAAGDRPPPEDSDHLVKSTSAPQLAEARALVERCEETPPAAAGLWGSGFDRYMAETATSDDPAATPAAAGRRAKAGRNELSTFVSDRLREMDTSKRQRALMVWATVGAAAVTVRAALWGVWMWLS